MKLLDKLLNNIRFEKKYVLFSMIIVILGIITGAFFIVILNTSDKNIVIEYISNFIDSIKNNNLVNINIFKNTVLTNYITVLLIAIVGFTFFFFFINILILFYKSFVLGFTISSFILTYGIKGSIFSLVYIFPHLIINLFIYMLIVSFTIKLSIQMINYIIKKKDVNMRIYFNKYFSLILLSSILILFTTLYESYVIPYIIKFIVKFI